MENARVSLALTCDEVRAMRWSEIDDLEEVVKCVNKETTWLDYLVECVVFFHSHLKAFFKIFILC